MATWTQAEVEAKVVALARERWAFELDLATGLRGRGATDMQFVLLAMALEETFEVDANDLEFAPPGTETTAASIAAFIWAKVDAKQQEEAKRKKK